MSAAVLPPLSSPEIILDQLKSRWVAPSDGVATQTVAAWQRPEGRYELVFHPQTVTPGASLTARELEVAQLVAAGLPNKIIAIQMGISNWTVCTHIRRIFQKLEVTTRAAMVARLHQEGLLR